MTAFDIAGRLCQILLPIPDEVFLGNPTSNTAVCTLSSMALLRTISKTDVMNRIALAGRLLSENRGIDRLIEYAVQHNITRIVLCGKDAVGHRPGSALLKLHKHGMDCDGRIICCTSPWPYLTVKSRVVEEFRTRVGLVDMIGCTELGRIPV